jgi:hypothetical protein
MALVAYFTFAFEISDRIFRDMTPLIRGPDPCFLLNLDANLDVTQSYQVCTNFEG